MKYDENVKWYRSGGSAHLSWELTDMTAFNTIIDKKVAAGSESSDAFGLVGKSKVFGATAPVVPKIVNTNAAPRLLIEGREYDLAANASRIVQATRTGSGRVTMLRDAWMVDVVYVYRPLLYYVIFGDDYQFELARLSVCSAIEFGCFDGDFLFITDKSDAYIKSLFDDSIHSRIKIFRMSASHVHEMWCCRYKFGQWPQADDYYPVLYVDTDIIIDRPLFGTLLSIARCQDKISVYEEKFARLMDHPPVGSKLFELDHLEVYGKNGFNSGMLGFPNAAVARPYFALIVEAIENYKKEIYKREPLKWLDQAIANYVLYKLNAISFTALAGRVRHASKHSVAGSDTIEGFVHFWSFRDKSHRAQSMVRYMEIVREYMKIVRSAPELVKIPY